MNQPWNTRISTPPALCSMYVCLTWADCTVCLGVQVFFFLLQWIRPSHLL